MKRVALWSTISLLGWLGLWILMCVTHAVDTQLVTPPWVIGEVFVGLLRSGYAGTPLYQHFLISLYRTLSGFLIGAAIGVPVGLLMGMNKAVFFIFNPLLTLLRPIPTIAFIPLVILWFGIGEISKITVIAVSAFLFIALNTYEGVLHIPQGFRRVALNLGASPFQMFARVILPGTAPAIMTGLKLGLAISWAVVVAAELIAAQQGLGYLIADAATFFRLPVVYIGVILIGVVGFTLEAILTKLERRVVHWKGK